MEENDYDKFRQKNIFERDNIFAELFGDIKKEQNEIKKELWGKSRENIENQLPKKRRKTQNSENFSNKGIRLQFRRTYNIRSRKNASTKDEFNDSNSDNEKNDLKKRNKNRTKLCVMFPWAKPHQRFIDLMNMDASEEEDDYSLTKEKYKYSKKKLLQNPDNILSVDEITQDMLDTIAKKSTQKIYCKINGTSCHQCRQKTMDTKTVCRSGNCIGIRGQFCGPCLQGRYGESAVEALKDPNWTCPPCRNLCNCSICRTKNGRRPTGILVGIAREKGYSSVMDYLQANTDKLD